MHNHIAVTKEPRWIKPVGIVFIGAGAFGLIPFKADYLQVWDTPLFVTGTIGVLLLLYALTKVGWRLNLEGNVLYYNKFNLYSTWKQRRSQEFALGLEKVKTVSHTGSKFIVTYEPGRKLEFNTRGLDSLSESRLEKLVSIISGQIK